MMAMTMKPIINLSPKELHWNDAAFTLENIKGFFYAQMISNKTSIMQARKIEQFLKVAILLFEIPF